MKYIRTKDGRIIDTTKEKIGLGYHPIESDTIEELFDAVVYDCLPRPHQSAYHKHEVSDVESLEWNKKPERFENVYGAIWTDKGLIYAAKMKGVLPNGEIDWKLLL